MGSPLTDEIVLRAAARFGTPLYLYAPEAVAARVQKVRQLFGGRFTLSYAVKSNPNPALLERLSSLVDRMDVSSLGELLLAMRAGIAASRVSFTGPAKRDFELRQAIASGLGELVIESPREAQLADRIAGELGRVQDILVRIAPASVPKGFGDHMAGRPSPFGIDIEAIPATLPAILGLKNLRWTGLHIYSGTQCLKAEAVVENHLGFIAIFREVCARYQLQPRSLVFGSGFGIPHHDRDTPLDLEAAAAQLVPALDDLQREERFASAERVLELGRFLVGEAGLFVTQVVGVKESRGVRVVICDGGLHHHLAASGNFGMVVPRNYRMHRVGGGEASEKVNLTGPLCTSIDRLGQGVLLPRLEEGDLLAVHASGAYGLTASPTHFISHPPPREVLFEQGELRDATRSLSDVWPEPGRGD